MASQRSWSVIIIGGGPAGLATALHLVARDPTWTDRLLVLEAKTHPRKKLCGGGLSGRVLTQLERLGLSLDIAVTPVDTARLVYAGRTIPIGGEPALTIADRAVFDAWLCDAARARGIVIQENEAVRNIDVQRDCVRVETNRHSYSAGVIVGADGSNSRVRKQLALDGPRRRARLLEVFHDAGGDTPPPEHTGSFATFDFSPTREGIQGYHWVFPTRQAGSPAINVGIFDAHMRPRNCRSSPKRVLRDALDERSLDIEAMTLEGFPIHRFHPLTRIAAPRVLLVGDAAGAEPLFGEGIPCALGYGEVAAAAINDSFLLGDFSFKRYRQQVLRAPVGRMMLIRWLLANVLYRAWPRPLLRAAWYLVAAAMARRDLRGTTAT